MSNITISMAWLCLALSLSLSPRLLSAQAPLSEIEPNQSTTTATVLALGQKATGVVASLSDDDFFALGTLPVGAYRLAVRYPQGAGPNGRRDWFIVLDGQGKEIIGSCHYPNSDHVFLFLVCAPSQVFVRVHPNLDLGLVNKLYELELAPDQDDPAECNNTVSTSRSIDKVGTYFGKLGVKDDQDMLRFKGFGAGSLEVKITYASPSAPRLIATFWKDPSQLPLSISDSLRSIDIKRTITAGDHYLLLQHSTPGAILDERYNFTVSFKPACNLEIDTSKIQRVRANCPLANGTIELPMPNNGTAPFSYRLDNGISQSNGRFTQLVGGTTYRAIATDAAGCADTVRVALGCLPCPLPKIGINKTQTGAAREVSFAAVVDTGKVVRWEFGDGQSSTATAPVHLYLQSGTYKVVVTAQNACGTSTATVDIVVAAGEFGLVPMEKIKPNQKFKVAFVSNTFSGNVVAVTGTVKFDTALVRFLGFANGIFQIGSTPSINPLNNAFSIAFGQGYDIKPKDTLFYLEFEAKTNVPPGALTPLTFLGGPLDFDIVGRVGTALHRVDATLVPGSISIVKLVSPQIKVTSPTGINVKGVKVGSDAKNLQGANAVGLTDKEGKAFMEVLYQDTIRVTVSKDTILLSGINIIDAVFLNRILVGLPTVGTTAYSPLAADFDGNSRVDALDVAGILNFIVGNITFPAKNQFLFIAESHIMPPFPSPNYFNVPSSQVLLNPDPAQPSLLRFIAVQRGDLDHSNAFLDRSPNPWVYSQVVENGIATVWLRADDVDYIGASFDLHFNRRYYTFESAQALKQGSTWAINSGRAAKGCLRAALLSTGITESSEPLVALRFRVLGTGKEPILLPNSNGIAVKQDGVGIQFSLVAENTVNNVQPLFWPNPANAVLKVALTNRQPFQVTLFDILGKQRYQNNGIAVSAALEIPTVDLPNGTYFLEINLGGQRSTRAIIIQH